MTSIERRDFEVKTVDGVAIGIREVRPERSVEERVPLILMQGLDVGEAANNGSIAEDLARAGHTCFVVDASGFGKSVRRPMRVTKDALPLMRSIRIARDMNAAADALRKATGAAKIGIVQSGIPIGAIYAALWPEKVSHLVLYGGAAPESCGDMIDASHIYCRVMIIDAEDDLGNWHDDLIHAQEVEVWRPKMTSKAAHGMFYGSPRTGRNEAMLRLLTFLQ